MKILLVHDYGTLCGGAEHMSVTLRDGLRDRGHDARLFASSAKTLDLPNVADYTCYGTMSPLRRVLQAVNPWAAARLRAVLKEFRPDVVHVRMFLTQLSPLILPALRGTPALLHVVNYHPVCPLGTKLLPDDSPCHARAGVACFRAGCLPLAGVARLAVQGALLKKWRHVFGLVVANSDWVRRRLNDDGFGVDETVWNGVPVRPARPPLTSPPTVAFAGRLVRKKGVDVLLRALARVAADVPDVRLLLAGDGPEREPLTRLAAGSPLGSRVTFLGHLSQADMERDFLGAWVQAVPSVWEEPFGLVAAEAMMRGTAVVVSESGGLGEIVPDGHAGLRVPPGDVESLARALLQILRSRPLAERMGRAGREHALAEFSEGRTVERFVELYEGLCAGRGATAEAVRAGAKEERS